MSKKKNTKEPTSELDETKHKEELAEIATIAKRMNELSDSILQRVDKKLAVLEAREKKWKLLEVQMEENAKKVKNKVILDVGGKRFITSKSTLLMHSDTYFTALLSSGTFEPEEDGSYFIDRNPKYFSIILEFLRTGNFVISHLNSEQVAALNRELDYYQIQAKTSVSVILSMAHEKTIEDWTRKKIGNLLWRATEHGFGADQYQARCFNKGSTVTVVKSNQGWIFGGYANTSWQSSGNYYGSGDCFIFTLANPHNIPPTKYPYNNNSGQCLYGTTNYGPTFGGGHDLYICSQSNTTNGSYTNFPHSYTDSTGKGNNTFTGARNFTTTEIEVFEMK